MTIAVGFLCTEGVIVAADTCIITQDLKKKEGPKVGAAYTANGTYAIANAADDGNAANALAVKILKDLEQNNYENRGNVEAVVANHMSNWWAGFGQNKPPNVSFVLGSVIKGTPGIYLCEPPSTVYLHDSYVGVGTGSAQTDPLVSTLFAGYDVSARIRLWQIAYLFYRAKKDDAFCDGYTTPIFLPLNGGRPMYIAHWEMKDAEDLGPQFDMYLRELMKNRMTHIDDAKFEEAMNGLTQVMKFISKFVQDIKFSPLGHDKFTQSDAQTSAGQQ